MKTMNITAISDEIMVLRNYFAQRAIILETDLVEACRKVDAPVAEGKLRELLSTFKVQRASESLVAKMPPVPTSKEPAVATYMLSTLTIQEAIKTLTTTHEEDLRFATGLLVAPKTYAITRLLQFELKRRSVVAAEADQESMARLLIDLYMIDHKLLMTLHSHPGRGPLSTNPSPIDLDFHQRLESGNYPVIGMIVNREGYVRFFSHKRAFKVSIYGKGMEVINEQSCVFKLNSVGAV